LAAQMLASTRGAVHFHCNPYSIKARDMFAIAGASVRRAKDNERSECVMAWMPVHGSGLESLLNPIRLLNGMPSLQAKALIRVADTKAAIHMQFENASGHSNNGICCA